MRKLLIFLTFALTFSGCTGWLWHSETEYQTLLQVPIAEDSSERIIFEVEPGMSTRSIAAKLAEKDLIPAAWVFEWYTDRNGLDGRLQAGRYVLRANWSTPRIAHTMLAAHAKETVVTIPEGYRLTQIDTLFADSGLTEPGDLLAQKNLRPDLPLLKDLPPGVDLEGYLFPDTYFFDPKDTTSADIITRLLTTMSARFTDTLRSDALAQGRDYHQILTVASLVERESFSASERPIIAGIIWKRLAEGIPLGIDATVQYAVSDDWPQSLTRTDLDTNSPYNTRKHAGLPPGPICSPSLSSIRAAIYPESTEYYFYLHDSEGKVHFARTNAQHNANKARYLH